VAPLTPPVPFLFEPGPVIDPNTNSRRPQFEAGRGRVARLRPFPMCTTHCFSGPILRDRLTGSLRSGSSIISGCLDENGHPKPGGGSSGTPKQEASRASPQHHNASLETGQLSRPHHLAAESETCALAGIFRATRLRRPGKLPCSTCRQTPDRHRELGRCHFNRPRPCGADTWEGPGVSAGESVRIHSRLLAGWHLASPSPNNNSRS
jgi:hypothetical protein